MTFQQELNFMTFQVVSLISSINPVPKLQMRDGFVAFFLSTSKGTVH